MTQTKLNPETVSVRIPFRIVKRGGRKEMVLPEGIPRKGRTNSSLLKERLKNLQLFA